MISWIYSFFDTKYILYSPARNAPNDGIGIKKLIEDRNNIIKQYGNAPPPPPPRKKDSIYQNEILKPNDRIFQKIQAPPWGAIITTEELGEKIKSLKPLEKQEKPTLIKAPLLLEFENVFHIGNANYFTQLKEKRKNSKRFRF